MVDGAHPILFAIAGIDIPCARYPMMLALSSWFSLFLLLADIFVSSFHGLPAIASMIPKKAGPAKVPLMLSDMSDNIVHPVIHLIYLCNHFEI